MLRNVKFAIPILVLAALFMFISPPQASARVHFGVYVGGPAYAYPPYPYGYAYGNPYGYYSAPYAYSYYPSYGYYGGYYPRYRVHHEWRGHREHEWRGYRR